MGCCLLPFWDEETKGQSQSNNVPTQHDYCYASLETKISRLRRKSMLSRRKALELVMGKRERALHQTGCPQIFGIPILSKNSYSLTLKSTKSYEAHFQSRSTIRSDIIFPKKISITQAVKYAEHHLADVPVLLC